MEKQNRKGLFISFEGIDGSGKSVQAHLLHKTLLDEKYDAIITREPGGTPTAECIRDLILLSKNGLINDLAEAYLFAASRDSHVKEKLLPALANNQVVICDRYIDSSLVYQGALRDLGIDTVYNINKNAIRGLLPDLTFLLTLSEQEYLRRMSHKTFLDRIENDMKILESFNLLKEAYAKVIAKFPGRFYTINGDMSKEEIAAITLGETHNLMERKGYSYTR